MPWIRPAASLVIAAALTFALLRWRIDPDPSGWALAGGSLLGGGVCGVIVLMAESFIEDVVKAVMFTVIAFVGGPWLPAWLLWPLLLGPWLGLLLNGGGVRGPPPRQRRLP